MWSGWVVWAWAWVWVCLPCLTHTHSTQEDPLLNPREAGLLTSLQSPQVGLNQLSNHLVLEVQGGEEAARTLAKKYKLHYIYQVFRDPPVYHLHKPINYNYNYHHHYHSQHRERRSTTLNLVQLLANEPGVKWVHQEREFIRVKRHQVQGFQRTRSLARPPARTTRKEARQEYKDIYVWLKEEELGLSNDLHYTPKSRKTKLNLRKDDIDAQNSVDDIDTQNSVDDIDTQNSVDDIGTQNSVDNIDTQNSLIHNNFPSSPNNINIEEEQSIQSDYLNTEEELSFNDPLFKDQWYLTNKGQLGHDGYDLNVTGAWRQGYTGHGVTLCILDDGFQTTNADLNDNYSPAVSYSLVHDGQAESDPSPRLDPPLYSNSHGTYCAGVAAAVANNGVCGVGVAYKAKVGGVRIVDGKVTDVQEATAMSRNVDKVDVFSASWGPRDDGAHLEGPGRLARRALQDGVTTGRGGLGTIYVWASGNGGSTKDNCNLDGYASSIYTLSVSAITDLGISTFYSEPCASTLAGVYVGGQHTLKNVLPRNSSQMQMKVVVPELDGHCSNSFQGSSAAAPLMAGVVALLLQANPRLGWRDVQHLVVEGAAPTPAALKEEGWHTNARGRKFHLLQGFGAVNAGKIVEAARTWHNVAPQKMENITLFQGLSDLASGWMNKSEEVGESTPMKVVEHVVATITLNHPQRSHLTIYIVSPSGTESQVLTRRPADGSESGFHGWEFTSVHLWGEAPPGVWTVAIKSHSKLMGQLIKIHLTVYGY